MRQFFVSPSDAILDDLTFGPEKGESDGPKPDTDAGKETIDAGGDTSSATSFLTDHDDDHDHDHVADDMMADAAREARAHAAETVQDKMPDHAAEKSKSGLLHDAHDHDHDDDDHGEGMHIHVRFEGTEGFVSADDLLAGDGSGTSSSAPSILGDMADYLSSGYWTRNGSTLENRFHNVSTTGSDPNNGVLLYNVEGFADDIDGLTEARAVLVDEAFKLFGSTLGIDFQRSTSTDRTVVDFFFSDNEAGAYAGSSIFSSGAISYSNINIASTWSGSTSTYDDYTFQTILHEIGHALGLGHQGPYNGSASYGTDNQFENDSWQASMMSYFSQTQNTSITASYEFLQTPMVVDWMALDDLYGSQGYGVSNAYTEDTVWGFNTTITSDVSDVWAKFATYGNRTASTIVDGGGNDTLDLSGYNNNTLINLMQSTRSDTSPALSDIGGRIGNLAIAEGTVIENAIGGAGSETFIGNSADNILTGNGGNDSFIDSLGSDTYLGGAGTDTVSFGQAFSNYSFTVTGAFLQVIDVAVDMVEMTVEWLDFDGTVFSWAELADGVVPNTAPVANNDAATVPEDSSVSGNVLANDTDADGNTLTVSAVNGQATAVGNQIALASGALLTLNADGTYVYDANGAFDALATGQTDQDSFTYDISDGLGGTDTATVIVTIDGMTTVTAPVAGNDSATIDEGATASGNVLSNDTDAEGDPLSVVAVNGSAAAVGQQITLNSGALVTLNANGSYSYDPNGAFDGLNDGQTATDSFSYSVSDGNGGTDTASVTITIDGISPAPAVTPIVFDFESAPFGDFAGDAGVDATGLSVQAGTDLSGARYAVSEGFTLTATDLDFDLDAAVFESAGGRVRLQIQAWDDGNLVGSQTVNLRSNRTVEINFGTGFDSVDEITVSANGTFLVDNLSLITRSFEGPGGNENPLAVDDTLSTDEGTVVVSNLLDNDTDADGGTLTLVAIEGDSSGIVTLQSGAQVSFASDGSISYDPAGAFDTLYDGQTAQDSFVYEIADGQGGTAVATATVTVSGIGTPPPQPTAVNIGFEGNFGETSFEEDGFIFENVIATSANLGVASGQQAAQSIGDSFAFAQTDGTNFDLESFTATALSGKNARLRVEGYDDGVLVGTETFRVRDNKETAINLTDASFDSVDEVLISVSGGLIVDDILAFA